MRLPWISLVLVFAAVPGVSAEGDESLPVHFFDDACEIVSEPAVVSGLCSIEFDGSVRPAGPCLGMDCPIAIEGTTTGYALVAADLHVSSSVGHDAFCTADHGAPAIGPTVRCSGSMDMTLHLVGGCDEVELSALVDATFPFIGYTDHYADLIVCSAPDGTLTAELEG